MDFRRVDTDDSSELAAALRGTGSADSAIVTSLATNERVIARVTDGIYREPASAIRELLSNAYDADATKVVVSTDAPRFDRILIEDDGIGMSPEVLSHMLKNIGGSAKRTTLGESLGVTADDDPLTSPSGRPLIGKLGIGLFSVSQLTRSFTIITKVHGSPIRTVAEVALRQFSEAGPDEAGNYPAGEVHLWTEPSANIEEHGTSITLTAVRPQTKESLRSRDIWDAVDRLNEEAEGAGANVDFEPTFHIGRVDHRGVYVTTGETHRVRFPWRSDDDPKARFQAMVEAVWRIAEESNPNPKLDLLFDKYLRMVWDLGLSLPVSYCDGSLFDQPATDWADFYALSNAPRGHAVQLDTGGAERVRDLLGLHEESTPGELPFSVLIDGVELQRPVRFRGLPATSHALKRPLVFLGKYREEFEGLPREISAGPLDFEAYLFWTPKVAPVDHRGVLVRIHGASGALFDSSFFKYQVSEQTRLRQIVCEIYVHEGLDAALNIDREAFNVVHPHMALLIKWVHGALRQLASAQKRAAQAVRVRVRDEELGDALTRLDEIVIEANERETDGEGLVPFVRFTDGPADETSGFGYSFDSERVFGGAAPFSRARRTGMDAQLKAILRVLSVYGLLDSLTQGQREDLAESLRRVLETDI